MQKTADTNADTVDYSQILHDVRIHFHTLTSALQLLKRSTGNGPLIVGGTDIGYFHDVMHDAICKGVALLNEALPGATCRDEEPFCVVSLLRGILNGISVLAENHGFSLIFSGPDECVLPKGKSKVERVVYNILTNALSHTPSNSVISIELKQADDFVVISVTDQGFGLTADQRRILTGDLPFPSGTENMYGLRSIRTQSDELGGYIAVENRTPVGMTVAVFFPRK